MLEIYIYAPIFAISLHTIMSSPAQRLGTVPGGEGIRREPGVNQGKMCLIIGVYQVMIVRVDLDRGKLALVNNILVRQGADVEPIMEANGVGSTLPKDVQLSLELPTIKLGGVRSLRGNTRAISRCEHHEWL